MHELKESVLEIIHSNQYLTIASCDSTGKAWASTVAYVVDEDYNFYWASLPSSRHQQNILNNPNISFAIFDSHQNWGEGNGLQIEATVSKVPFKNYPSVTYLYFNRKYPYGQASGKFGQGLRSLLSGKVYRFYKAIPKKVWIPDPNAEVDARIETKIVE